jgi:hypothetical protein
MELHTQASRAEIIRLLTQAGGTLPRTHLPERVQGAVFQMLEERLLERSYFYPVHGAKIGQLHLPGRGPKVKAKKKARKKPVAARVAQLRPLPSTPSRVAPTPQKIGPVTTDQSAYFRLLRADLIKLARRTGQDVQAVRQLALLDWTGLNRLTVWVKQFSVKV